jgi:hypothetical protein
LDSLPFCVKFAFFCSKVLKKKYSCIEKQNILLQLEGGKVKFAYNVWPSADALTVTAKDIADAEWHNVTVVTTAEDVTLAVDGQQTLTVTYAFTPAVSVVSEFAFDSLEITSMDIGGSGHVPGGSSVNGEYYLLIYFT